MAFHYATARRAIRAMSAMLSAGAYAMKAGAAMPCCDISSAFVVYALMPARAPPYAIRYAHLDVRRAATPLAMLPYAAMPPRCRFTLLLLLALVSFTCFCLSGWRDAAPCCRVTCSMPDVTRFFFLMPRRHATPPLMLMPPYAALALP